MRCMKDVHGTGHLCVGEIPAAVGKEPTQRRLSGRFFAWHESYLARCGQHLDQSSLLWLRLAADGCLQSESGEI